MELFHLLIVCICYLQFPIVCSIMRSNAKSRTGLVLSVTVPPERLDSPEVQMCIHQFLHRLYWAFGILSGLLFAALALPWTSVLVTVSLFWIPLSLFTVCTLYGISYRSLLSVKQSSRWPGSRPAMEARDGDYAALEPVRLYWYTLPFLLTLLPLMGSLAPGLQQEARLRLGLTSLLSMALCLMCPMFHRFMSTHWGSELRGVTSGAQQAHWSRVWLLFSWLTAVYSVAVWLTVHSIVWYMILTVLYTLFLVVSVLVGEMAAHAAQVLKDQDEDCRWVWGQYYYNPNVRRTLVREQGSSTATLNYATSWGRLLGICAIVLLLALPMAGIWCMGKEFSPRHLLLSDDTVVVYHMDEIYQVPVEAVIHTELLPALPEYRHLSGLRFSTSLDGLYEMKGYDGVYTFCLDPTYPPFLLLETSDRNYIFSGDSTEAIYEAITK